MQKPPSLAGRRGFTQNKFFYRNIVSVRPDFNQAFRQAEYPALSDSAITHQNITLNCPKKNSGGLQKKVGITSSTYIEEVPQ